MTTVETTADPLGGARLEFVAEARVRVDRPRELGPTMRGRKRVITIADGSTVEGPRLRGRIVPGGADWQTIWADGTAELIAYYMIETHDGVFINVFNRGLRHGPPEVVEKLIKGEPVEPGSYYFRTSFTFDAPEGPYHWLNRSIFVGAGEREPDLVLIRILELV